MTCNRHFFIIDTNVLIDYPDIIPNGDNQQPNEPTVDLSNAHIIIPTTVIRELSKFKRESSYRGKASREALKRIRQISKDSIAPMRDTYRMKAPLKTRGGNQLISILPVHKDFKKSLPFNPSSNDMDGQIILTAISVMFILKGLPIDGTATNIPTLDPTSFPVTIITNDNGLAIRANCRGVATSRYGNKHPEPYTGRRSVVVSAHLFSKFLSDKALSLEDWQRTMPLEPPLVANEFIIMSLNNPRDYPEDFDPDHNPYFRHIGRYDADAKTIFSLNHLANFPTSISNDGQAIYAEALANPQFSAVVCSGAAGTGKTYMSTIYCLDACKNGLYMGAIVVPCEDRGTLGAMPGDMKDKMDPFIQPFKNALRNFVIKDDKKFQKDLKSLQQFAQKNEAVKPTLRMKIDERTNAMWQDWFSSIPVEKARGRDFSYELALYDEFQDQNIRQADTLIKRIGYGGKIIITGDIQQIHAPYLDAQNNGITYAEQQLFDNPMVARVHFIEDEVIRHPLVQAIAKRQKERQSY